MEQAIHDILKDDAAVAAVIGTRIYPLIIPQWTLFPCITYQRITDTPTNDKDGVSRLDVIKIDIDMWGDKYSTLKDLKTKVRTALDNFDGTKTGFTINVIFEAEQDLFEMEADSYHINQSYSIRLKR